jgi:hypothetical protein
MLTSDQIKWLLLVHIGGSIDENSLSNYPSSFVEMDEAVIHIDVNNQTKYFKVTLTECDESAYWTPSHADLEVDPWDMSSWSGLD